MMQPNEDNQTDEAKAVATRKRSTARISPPYLMLDAHCWEHILDYLGLTDIIALSELSDEMTKLCGHYLHDYYPQIVCNVDDMPCGVLNCTQFAHSYLVTPLCPYVRKLSVKNLNHDLNYYQHCSVKTLIFDDVNLFENSIHYARYILPHIENIQIDNCFINSKMFKVIAEQCPKLKTLNIRYCFRLDKDTFKAMFAQYFPSLVKIHLEYCPQLIFGVSSFPIELNISAPKKIDEMKMFIEKHSSTLKELECDCDFLWANRALFNQLQNVQFDRLSIYFDLTNVTAPLDEFEKFLTEIHQQNVYKHLSLSVECYITNTDNLDHLNRIISTLPSLDMLNTLDGILIDLTKLTNLKDLRILNNLGRSDDATAYLEKVAKNLTKLEQLSIYFAHFDDILPFIRHSKRLKTVRVFRVRSDEFNIFALNEERKKLENARFVTIRAPEDVYLREKCKSKNVQLECVQIARLDDTVLFT